MSYSVKSQYNEAGKSVQVLCCGSSKSTVLVSFKQSRISTVHTNKFRPVTVSFLISILNEVNFANFPLFLFLSLQLRIGFPTLDFIMVVVFVNGLLTIH